MSVTEWKRTNLQASQGLSNFDLLWLSLHAILKLWISSFVLAF